MKRKRINALLFLMPLLLVLVAIVVLCLIKQSELRFLLNAQRQTLLSNQTVEPPEVSLAPSPPPKPTVKPKLPNPIPEEADVTTFIEEFLKVAESISINDVRFNIDGKRPHQGPAPAAKVQVYTITFNFQSGYREVYDLIQRLQRLERLTTIESMSVARGVPKMTVSLQIGLYART